MGDTLTLERRICDTLASYGRLNPSQIATLMKYPIGAVAEAESTFFGALEQLEKSGKIESYPTVKEIPTLSPHLQNNPYIGRVYRLPTLANSPFMKWMRQLLT
jgi:hypothetical protein